MRGSDYTEILKQPEASSPGDQTHQGTVSNIPMRRQVSIPEVGLSGNPPDFASRSQLGTPTPHRAATLQVSRMHTTRTVLPNIHYNRTHQWRLIQRVEQMGIKPIHRIQTFLQHFRTRNLPNLPQKPQYVHIHWHSGVADHHSSSMPRFLRVPNWATVAKELPWIWSTIQREANLTDRRAFCRWVHHCDYPDSCSKPDQSPRPHVPPSLLGLDYLKPSTGMNASMGSPHSSMPTTSNYSYQREVRRHDQHRAASEHGMEGITNERTRVSVTPLLIRLFMYIQNTAERRNHCSFHQDLRTPGNSQIWYATSSQMFIPDIKLLSWRLNRCDLSAR